MSVRRVVTAVGALIVVALLAVGLIGSSGPSSTPLAPTTKVVLVSVPGLRWQDLDAVDAPAIARLLTGSAMLSVRSIGPETSLLEGYLALNAGNRLQTDPTGDLADDDAVCLPRLVAAATADADDDLNGADPAALGTALRAAGLTTAVYGSTAAVAGLMDDSGCVGLHQSDVAWASFDADVTLIEFGGLQSAGSAADRTAAIVRIDDAIDALPLPMNATVVLFAPAATDDVAEVLVIGVRDVPQIVGATSSLVSPSTRRADYVQLTDVGPTVLDVLGAVEPDSMSGTVIAATPDRAAPQTRVHDLADISERVVLRDRAVGPVSVVLVVLLVLCGVAGLGRRARVARMLAPIVLAYPTVTFLLGLTAYHQLPLDFLVVAIPALAIFVAAVTVAFTSRWGPFAPVTVLAVVLWLTMVVDVVTGGSLQINTPLGYSPTVAGRFQGFGNLTFGLVGGAAMVVAVAALLWPGLRLPPVRWAAWVACVTVIVVGAPAFGSDVGGTLALVPAFAALLTVMSGRRIRAGRAALVVLATVAIVGVMAVLDRSRAPASRTHLGRFLDDLLDGDGGLIIRRKLHGNMAILTSSFWSLLLVPLFLAAVALAWRRREQIARMLRARPPVHAFVVGFVVAAVLGFALNDSGLAVPAIMLDVAVPWLVAVMIPVVKRAGR
jgi:hypothetical protein